MNMNKIEINQSKEMSISEKQLFMWMNDNHINKKINLPYTKIAEQLGARLPRNIVARMDSLIKKGFIEKTKYPRKGKKCNQYKILK